MLRGLLALMSCRSLIELQLCNIYHDNGRARLAYADSANIPERLKNPVYVC